MGPRHVTHLAALAAALMLAVSGSASAQPNALRTSPPVWVSVRCAPTVAPVSLAAAAQAELERMVRARPTMRLGSPPGVARAYVLEIQRVQRIVAHGTTDVLVSVVVLDAAKGNLLAMTSGLSSGTQTSPLRSPVDLALAGAWSGIPALIEPSP